MDSKINLGKVDSNSFKESKAASIARLVIEQNNKIKTHFMEMDRTPNFDGKLMILEDSFERITVEVQIKTLPPKFAEVRDKSGEFSFDCDTKAMNAVKERVTFNPVVLFVVNTNKMKVYYKILNLEYVRKLDIGTKKTKRICFSEKDFFNESTFIKEIYREVKINSTDYDCVVKCARIRSCIKNPEQNPVEKYHLVYERNNVRGFFSAFLYNPQDINYKPFIVSHIKMTCGEVKETLAFQHNKDFIHINRARSELSEITDSDIANIVLEVSKEVQKPILYTCAGKPAYWFSVSSLWQLRAEEIYLPWYFRL